MIQIVVVCDILEDLRLEVKVENDVGSFTTTLEIVLMLYPNTGISALIRDMTWLQDNICPMGESSYPFQFDVPADLP